MVRLHVELAEVKLVDLLALRTIMRYAIKAGILRREIELRDLVDLRFIPAHTAITRSPDASTAIERLGARPIAVDSSIASS